MKAAILIAWLLCFAVGLAGAQDCTIAAYGDPEGTVGTVDSSEFTVYVVMFVENTVAAAAYSLHYRPPLLIQARFTGPSGNGLHIDEPTGTNSALGECVVGFGGNPVVIDEYRFVVLPYGSGPEDSAAARSPWGFIDLGPNPTQDPDNPVYVTCNDITLKCEIGPTLCLGCGVPNEATSFGSIKALY